MNSVNQLILFVSEKHVGLKEIVGAEDNATIVKWLTAMGIKNAKDEIAWCAAAMNGILGECHVIGTGSPTARSFLTWGAQIPWEQKRPGDIVILQRGNQSWQGHVGIYLKEDPNVAQILVRGGNQSNSYNEQWFPDDRVIGIRRAKV